MKFKYDVKKVLCLIVALALIVFFTPACGSKGGKATEGDGGDDGGGVETPPQPTFNLTGTVIGVNGNALPQVRIWAIQGAEDLNSTVTDASGQFSMNLAEEIHTIVASRQGFISASRIVDLTSGDPVEQILILRTSNAPSELVGAPAGGSVASNDQDTQLDIPSQTGGIFNGINESGASDASKATFSVERLDLSKALPVPLPSPDTLAAGDIIIDGKQAPSLMLSINPPLLEMPNAATLALPNPDQLANARILRFDPYEQRWSVVGTTDDTPADGTSLTVSDAGVYGIFYETDRTVTVKGTATPGSVVHVGDEVLKVLSDGTFYAGEVALPANGQLEIVAIGPDGEVIEVTEQDLSPGDIITVPMSIVGLNAVTVTAGDEQIAADGVSTTSISATVLNENREAAPDGTEVVFSTTSGILSCPQNSVGCVQTLGGARAETRNGVAQVVLTSSSIIGTATVTATVDGLSGQDTIEFVAGLPDRADVSASPKTLTANGSMKSTIQAVVYDAADRPLGGRRILFTLDPVGRGALSASVATTSQEGVASVEYTAPTIADDSVKVSVKEEGGVKELGAASIDFVRALPDSIEVSKGADSVIADRKTVSITATVKDFTGSAVSDGTDVIFSTSAGTFKEAEDDQNDNDKTDIELGTQGGRATATLISPTNVGTATITITSEGVYPTEEITVSFVPGPPFSVTASASPSKLTVGRDETSNITVTVRDKNNNLVTGETVLTGNNDQGQYGFLSPGTDETDENGAVTFEYTPPSLVPDEGKDELSFQTTNGVNATVEIQLEGPRIASMEIGVEPASLPADGVSKATVIATLTMVGGDPPPNDTPVYFKVKEGGGYFDEDVSIVQSSTVDGEAIARLTAGGSPTTAIILVGTDKFTDPNDPDNEIIGGIVQEIEIEYTPGSISLLIAPNVVLGTGQESIEDCENGTALNCVEIIATLNNEEDLPAADESVEFYLDGSPGMSENGTIQPQQAVTDAEGTVNAWYMAPDEGGEVTVTATWNATYTDNAGEEKVVEITETGTITVNPPPASINVVEPATNEISVRATGGQETVQLFFDVKDNAGDPVVDGYRVDFEIVTGPGGGELLTKPFDLTEGGAGRVGTVLRSGYRSGPVSVKATSFHDSNVSTVVSQVSIKAGPPVGGSFGLTTVYNNISGINLPNLINPLTAGVVDYYGNSVPNNTAVSFKTYSTGGLVEEQTEDTSTTDGFAYSNLISTPAPLPLQGFVSVTAETPGGRTTHVTSIDLVPVDFSAKDRHVVFVGTDGGGVYKSLDSGKTWENRSRSSEHPGQNFIHPYVNDIAIDRDEPKIVYAATGFRGKGNLYRSLDGGLNWNSGDAEEWNGLIAHRSSDLSDKLHSAMSVVLCDYDDSDVPYQDFPYVWAGSESDGVFFSDDGVIFIQSEGLGKGHQVNDIVRIPDTHGDDAVLYAATDSGVYKSYPKDGEESGGGRKWFYDTNDPNDGVPGPIFGDHVNTLAVHSTADGGVSDILYAGTEDAGVWVSTDSGKSWRNYTEGLGEGLMATPPVANVRNRGTGRVTSVGVGKETRSENWLLVYDEAEGSFSVTGSDSGTRPNAAVGDYRLENELSFTIVEGNIGFVTGDSFTFTTIRNPGLNIKKLLLDETNKRLYAATYFEPDGFHPVGNLYYYELKSDGSGFLKKDELWREANDGLPQFDPPDDRTLLAHHDMALIHGPFGETKSLFVGGEGISFYKADISNEIHPDWKQSQSGMDNTLMARTPVLFSGYCDMMFPYIAVNGQEIDENTTIEVGDVLYFEVLIEDVNGNPPIDGSNLLVELESNGLSTIFERTYPDVLTFDGTWTDRSDDTTYLPFRLSHRVGADDTKLIFTFTPVCAGTSPGCSGIEQIINFPL